jgi:gamma-glutamylcysteine synthetase
VRSADLPPDPRIFAVPCLWTGLLYHPEVLAWVREACRGHATHEAWTEAMDSAARQALDGSAGGRPLRELAGAILRGSIHGLRNGAACAGHAPDPAAPLVELARELELDVAGDFG